MGNSPSNHHASVAETILEISTSNDNKSESSPDKSKSNDAPLLSTGKFNPNIISIQTLGSGGPTDDVSGGIYNIDLTNQTGQQTFLGVGVGGGQNASSDTLLTSIPKDLTTSVIGGQLVAIGRLWPGSGRMMRSYRIRVKVPRIDSKIPTIETTASDNNNNTNITPASLPHTIELACKAFIVQSEEGEAPLRLALTEGDAELKRLRSLLSNPTKHPHVLSYARWVVGQSSSSNSQTPVNTPVSRPIYLLRQHAHASLSDRLVSRPFLTLIEKNWITYQLLKAVQSLHDAGICHGHLTTENVLLTSWNWVLISDVGCQHYKPVVLPDDDPAQYIHWFQGRGGEDAQTRRESLGGHHSGNGEKKCCLAPERFYTPGKDESSYTPPTKLTPAMDVFSLGCVLIELFLNGERAMDLGDLMEYKRHAGEGDSVLPQSLKQKLDKIESSKMRAACKHMLTLDPSSRLSPTEYLDRLSSSSTKKKRSNSNASDKDESKTHLAPVPPCFKTALYPFMLRLRTQILSPDARIAMVACNYGEALKATVGVDDEWGVAYFTRVLGPTLRRFDTPSTLDTKSTSSKEKKQGKSKQKTQKDINSFSLDELLVETEDLLRQLDSGLLGYDKENSSDDTVVSVPKPLSIFNYSPKSASELPLQPSTSQSSIIILLQVVFSSVGHVQRASSKFVALQMMHRIALYCSDDIRLQRIVPYVTSLLQDSEPIVRASSISVLASVLAVVTTFPPSDASIFPRYVFKKVAHMITDPSLVVRVAFAHNIALLAETARRFLDVGHSVSLYEAVAGKHSRADGNDKSTPTSTAIFSEDAANLLGKTASAEEIPASSSNIDSSDTAATTTIKSTYDSDLAVLHEVVFRWVIHITTDASDHSSQSKQALLKGLSRLCNFFGSEYSFQVLPIILAFLNDRKDWQLRAALCKHLPSVCVSVGRAATEQFVIPCIETALNDDVESVISEALCCLSSLISLSLLTRISLLGTEITGTTLPLPNESPTRARRKKQGVIRKCGPLLLHPSRVVRTKAASLVLTSWQVLGETDGEVFLNQLLRPYLQYKPTFESIAQLFACLKSPSFQKDESLNLGSLELSDIDSEIEISVKLASSLSVPSQQFVELVSKNSLRWYEPLLHAASRDQGLSAPFFSLGFASLQRVHALKIEVPVNTSNQILINRSDEQKLSDMVRNKEDITVETINLFLTRPEVKVSESSCKGEWGSASVIDQLVPENSSVHSKVLSLDVPPLSQNFGLARTGNSNHMRQNWCPKEDNLIATTDRTEHVGPVNRLAVSEDQSFFVSASFDGTSKVFELQQAYDTGGDIHSCLTYDGHKAENDPSPVRINDVSILENSHTVATAASDGSLHVWRCDVTIPTTQQTKRPRVSGHSVLRNVNTGEGEVLAVSHFNTSSASILAFATQQGNIHSLDLRSSREPFTLNLRPELGYLTDMEVGKDKNWIVAGTSRGYVGLWDVRYQTMVKLWRHSGDSSIKRLSDAFGNSLDDQSQPLVFMGCDNNEASLFDISNGACLQCYRVLDSSLSYVDQAALPSDCLSVPYLENVNIPSSRSGKRLVSLDKAIQMTSRSQAGSTSINALAGSINLQGASYLMTGGSDQTIRCWDLNSASKSSCISGAERNQPPASFSQLQVGGNSRLILCRQPSIHPSSLVESSRLPLRNRQGVVKCESRHLDSILDLKVVKNPALLLSASRDYTIKLWG